MPKPYSKIKNKREEKWFRSIVIPTQQHPIKRVLIFYSINGLTALTSTSDIKERHSNGHTKRHRSNDIEERHQILAEPNPKARSVF